MHPRERRSTRRHFLFSSAGSIAALSGADALLRDRGGIRRSRRRPDRPGRDPARAPQVPGHPPDLLGQRADLERQEPGEGAAEHLHVVGLHQPGCPQELREGHRREGQDHDLRERGGGARKAHVGAGELRRVVRDRRLPLTLRRGEADPAAQPLLPVEPEERVAVAAEPVLRRALALLGAVYRLHDGHRLPQGQGEAAAHGLQRVLAGEALLGQGGDPRRPARGARDGTPPPRHRGRQHGGPETRERGRSRPQEADLARQREDERHRVHRRPHRGGVARPGLVGRHGRRDQLHAEGRARERCRLLAAERGRRHRQRHDHDPARRQEPGARTSLPRLPARQQTWDRRTSRGSATCRR